VDVGGGEESVGSRESRVAYIRHTCAFLPFLVGCFLSNYVEEGGDCAGRTFPAETAEVIVAKRMAS
jgi:hypothetical protein